MNLLQIITSVDPDIRLLVCLERHLHSSELVAGVSLYQIDQSTGSSGSELEHCLIISIYPSGQLGLLALKDWIKTIPTISLFHTKDEDEKTIYLLRV